MKSKGHDQGCILRRSPLFRSFGVDIQEGCGQLFISHGVITWHNLAKVVTVIFANSRSVPFVAYIARIVTDAGSDLGSGRPGPTLHSGSLGGSLGGGI